MTVEPLCLRALAKEITWDTDRAALCRLVKFLRARERDHNVRLILGGGKRGGPRLQVSLATLYRHCPELRPSKVRTMEAELKSYLRSIDERMRVVGSELIADQVDPELERQRRDIDQVANAVTGLGIGQQDLVRRVDRLEKSTR